MQQLIEHGEYANITDIVRDAVKRFRLEWSDMEAVQSFMPMGGMMRTRMMPRMKRMMRSMFEDDEKE
jgi:Arc/MetJ-type ribon-helix-helix transcriptional regulator